ncbi:SLBB domain-containing protein [Marinobacter sp. 1Y8]
MPSTAIAQSITASRIEQFQSLPEAQQESLARRYGIDLDELRGQQGSNKVPKHINVVTPLNENFGDQDAMPRHVEESESDENGPEKGAENNLKPYGYDLFAGSPSTFAPVTEIPIPNNYVLGPGDVITVQLWGKENKTFVLPISRSGTIEFPQHGPLSLAGQSFDDARARIENLVSEQYIGVRASVGLGELRSIRVFILGEARHPGAYTVSSLSTVTNALFVSGGVRTSGSLRKIAHKRNGKLVSTLDLYDLLLKGDTSGDDRLQAGDVVFIPPVGPRIAVEGEVYRPALYELNERAALQSVIELAGGMTPKAYPQKIRIERTGSDYVRVVKSADLTSAKGRQMLMRSGDHVDVASVSDMVGMYVALKGAAVRPGSYAWVPGMRLNELIRNLGADLKESADRQVAAVVRTDKATGRISVSSVRLREALTNPESAANIALEERDQVLVFTDAGKLTDTEAGNREVLFKPVLRQIKAQATHEKQQQTFSISGPVNYPGEYPLPQTHSLQDAILLAGGLNDTASLYTAELARNNIGNDGVARTQIQELDLAAVLRGEPAPELQGRDSILIKPIPDFDKTRSIALAGEVVYPGSYTFGLGETLRDVLARAGGVTGNAFPRGAVFTRAKLRSLELQRLEEAKDRLQGDLLGVQLEGGRRGGSEKIEQVEGLLKDVQSARPVGRMVIDLAQVIGNEAYTPIQLQDGDRLTVPTIPQSVSVFGEVQFPTSHLQLDELTVDDYLERSGGFTRQADVDRVYVVKADGSVMLPESSQWFGGRSQEMEAGDTVIVPIDVDRLNQLELWTDVSQIFYQIGLGAAAVGNL